MSPPWQEQIRCTTVFAGDEHTSRPISQAYAGPHPERPFPPVLFVFAAAPPRAAPATREMEFHERARGLTTMGYRITVATTTLSLLTKHGAGKAVWRVVGRGEDRLALGRPPKAR